MNLDYNTFLVFVIIIFSLVFFYKNQKNKQKINELSNFNRIFWQEMNLEKKEKEKIINTITIYNEILKKNPLFIEKAKRQIPSLFMNNISILMDEIKINYIYLLRKFNQEEIDKIGAVITLEHKNYYIYNSILEKTEKKLLIALINNRDV